MIVAKTGGHVMSPCEKALALLGAAALWAGCVGVGAHKEITLAEYRRLTESPEGVLVENRGEWTLVHRLGQGYCAGSEASWTRYNRVEATFRIRTALLEGGEGSERPEPSTR